MSSPTLTNCTFTGNSASNGGGGLFNDSSSSPTLTNCILWGNTAPSGSQVFNSSGTPVATYCDVEGGYTGTGNINADPQFVHVPNSGPDGTWGTADDGTDLRLRLTSPCIDAGKNSAVPAGITTDLAGSSRRADIPAKANSGSGTVPIVDMGAYEAVPAIQVLPGGPYGVPEGNSVVLSGAGYSPQTNGAPVTYAWDFDADGIFDDAVGPTPTFSAAGLQPQTLTIALRVTALGASATQTTLLRVLRPVYVDDSASGLNDGTSWTNAYTSLQSALLATVAGQVVWVGQGIYKPTTDTDRTASFRLGSSVSIYGGYAGYSTADPNVRNVLLYPSVLSGDIGTVGSVADNSYHVVVAMGVDATAVLDGCTITGGHAYGGSSTYVSGGGMYVYAGSPTLTNCTFTANSATHGGGLFNDSSSSPTLTNCTFTANSATYEGGGLFNYPWSSPTLTNCTFTANSAGQYGGGLYNDYYSSPTLTNCILWENTAPSGSQVFSGIPVVTYCDVQGGYTGVGNINADPQFVRNPSPGLDGVWGTADDDYGDLRSRPFSPVVDAGKNSVVPVGVTTDLAGNSRFVDISTVADTGVGTPPIVDMGAYEFTDTTAPTMIGSPNDGTEADITYQTSTTTISANWAGVFADLESGISRYDWAIGTTSGGTDAQPYTSVGTSTSATNESLSLSIGATYYVTVRATNGTGLQSTSTTNGVTAVPVYVDDSATGLNDGTSWANAYASLQSALLATVAGQVIWVGQGTYKPTSGIDRTASFVLKNGVSIYGGYAGVGATNSDARAVALYPSVLSGDIGFLGNTADNSYYVVVGSSGTNATAVLDGFTITAGNANGGYPTGGGLYNYHSSPTLTNCTFTANSATHGGGLYNYLSSPTLTNCTFTANSAGQYGGGLYNDYSSSPTLTNCILWENTAPSGSQVFNSSGTPVATYCDIQGGYTGAGNINADPQFVRNPNSGYDGTWGTADDDYGDLRLRLTSPCIDAGKNSAVPAGITTDLAGSSRRADIPAKANSGSGTVPIVDMGAYEAVPAIQVLPGGPYRVLEGNSIVLSGAGYSPQTNGAPVTYAWDFDTDGIFDDATGPTPTFLAAGLQPQTLTIALRVTDALGASAAQTTLLRVLRPVYVDDSASGLNDGTSWTNAYTSLQSALLETVAGQVVWVGQGIYEPTTGTDRTVSFVLKNGVSIYGGYTGVGTPDPNARNVISYPSILSGDIGIVGYTADNSYHVVVGNNTNSTAVLDGFTITSGNAIGSNYSGGGMYNSSGSPTLTNCTFTANSAGQNGGGLYNLSSSPTLTNCTFTGNSATHGGGLYNYLSSPTLTNCTFTANSAGQYGGGLHNYYSSLTLTNCTFTGNSASNGGGGLHNSSSSPTLTNCILWGNTAPSGSQVFNSSGTPVATYCDVEGGYTGAGNINADPQFVRNPNSGYDGTWGTADDDYGDLRLRLTSPCIDAGKNSAVLTGITTDLAGSSRFADIPAMADTGTGTSPIVDIGAYEAVPAIQVLPGGPYGVLEGNSIVLFGAGYSPQTNGAPVTYAWDFDADGIFDDATGPAPTFSAAGLQPQTLTIALRVTDALGASATQTTRLRVIALVVYVDDSSTGLNNGTSWANAYTSLQSALLETVAGQVVWVGQGTYKPTTGTDRTVSFVLKNGVSIYGGYAGVGATNPDAHSVTLYPSVLSGDIGESCSPGDNSYHVVVGSGTDPTAVLDGFTITAGNTYGSVGPMSGGGGLYNSAGSPTLTNCTFTANYSVGYGGGLSNYADSSPTLTNCTFTANSAFVGGGLNNYLRSSPRLTNCTFTANSADHEGGGLYNYADSSPTLTNCTFTANNSTGYGGGIYNASSCSTLINCILWANTAAHNSQVYNSSIVTYCDIESGDIGTGYDFDPQFGNFIADPQFVRNPSPGLDGVWGTADDDYGDLRLLPTSPCIDAGKNAAVPVDATIDLAGNPRFADVPVIADSGLGTAPIVDIGAYESPNPTFALAGSSGFDLFSLGLTVDHGSVQIISPAGTQTYAVGSITVLRFDGAAGNDNLTLNFSNSSPLPSGGLIYEGGADWDCLAIRGTSGDDIISISGSAVTVNSLAPITYQNVEQIDFQASSPFRVENGAIAVDLTGSGQLVKNGSGTTTLSGDNNYSGGTTVLGGTLLVTTANALPDGGSLTIGAGGILVFDCSLNQAAGFVTLSEVLPTSEVPVSTISASEAPVAMEAMSLVVTEAMILPPTTMTSSQLPAQQSKADLPKAMQNSAATVAKANVMAEMLTNPRHVGALNPVTSPQIIAAKAHDIVLQAPGPRQFAGDLGWLAIAEGTSLRKRVQTHKVIGQAVDALLKLM